MCKNDSMMTEPDLQQEMRSILSQIQGMRSFHCIYSGISASHTCGVCSVCILKVKIAQVLLNAQDPTQESIT